jgi:large subunit ribosomal protein L20
MPRSKNKVAARRRKKGILALAKGFWGRRSKVFTVAKNSVHRSLVAAYDGRRQRKRQFRRLWITRINAAARQNDLSYSRMVGALRKSPIRLNRKVLADLAVHDPAAFSKVVDHLKIT